MDRSLFKKHRETLVVIGVVLVSLLVAKKVYDFELGRAARIKEDIRKEEQKAMTLDRIVVLNERLKELRAASWSSTDFASIVDVLTAMADKTGLLMQDVTPIEKKDGTYLISMPFYINATATYRQVARFLAAARAMPEVIRLHEVTLTPEPSGDTAAYDIMLVVHLRGEVVYVK